MDSSNYREICSGRIAPGLLYRSDHPIYNGEQVKEIVLAAQNAKIKTVINLSDSMRSLGAVILCCPWYKNLFDTNSVIALDISMRYNVMDDKFCKKIRDGLLFMINHEPPYLLHCSAGIDRTGLLSMLLEALMGANLEDIVKDYMLSFVDDSQYSLKNYNNNSSIIMNVFAKIKGDAVKADDDLQYLSEQYLLKKIKLKVAEIQMLANKLTGNKAD